MINGVNRYVFLDTNIVSKSIRKPSDILERRMEREWAGGTRYLLSVIVVHELERSVLGSENPAGARERLNAFMNGISGIAAFEPEDAKISASIHQEMETQGVIIGVFDIFIAAQALRRNLPMVTNNTKHFSRVGGLLCEDWTI